MELLFGNINATSVRNAEVETALMKVIRAVDVANNKSIEEVGGGPDTSCVGVAECVVLERRRRHGVFREF